MTVSSQIIEVLNDLCAKFGMVIDWSEENILPYVQTLVTKFIAWEIATSWMWIGAAIFIILVGVAIIIFDRTDWDTDIITAIGIIAIFISIVTIVCQITDIITCKTFPEKEIYDFISKEIAMLS